MLNCGSDKCSNAKPCVFVVFLFIMNLPPLIIYFVLVISVSNLDYNSEDSFYGSIIGYKITDIINIVLSLLYASLIIVLGRYGN